ncbi:phosphodiester glycosidase family protein [Treponema phagedenis]|uniref:Phosphodiester glycosidase family protein n=1 Tax=Treponema phagedenis TaxID=162 RepID=A0A0B7GTJ0_TREPH|nr:phosphodiester glycosidase family protein [Treponema phagedenis]NVP23858.1 phosphodiester glycosidase family protein [Treponema phagedenis]QEJ96352.1 phosphodiester glycosidase family protein [Treponema phagedenis]QEJ99511.1 phosphodiester glycosidase family protein [Treponema phagedenis]QEK02150.1 phosphodiester glycosidase family protein [Treponema phagedenis]QEK05082.1 phosphodiester glycosidase family protein [Treponema phagedenis]
MYANKKLKSILLFLFLFVLSSCATPPLLNPKIPTKEELAIEPQWQKIEDGIELAEIRIKNMPLILHAVRIDLTNPHLSIVTSEKKQFIKKENGYDGSMKAETVLRFAKRNKASAAINAAMFEYGSMLFGRTRKIIGIHISEGEVLSAPNPHYAALLFTNDKQALIIDSQKDIPENIAFAVSGIYTILRNGKILDSSIKVGDSRTAVGIANNGKTLILLLVEAENTKRSQGLDFESTALFLKRFGAEDGLHLDGGGSSTLVVKKNGAYKVIAPTIAFLPLRRVASCLGFVIHK